MTPKELRLKAILDLIEDCFSLPISHIKEKHGVSHETITKVIDRLKAWGHNVETRPVGRPKPREMTVTEYAAELGLSKEQFQAALVELWAGYRTDQLVMLGEYLQKHHGEI